jgi:CRISPR-associated protein Cas5h
MMARRQFVAFEVASDIAHFRRQYAITTALTYVVPPRTALCGLVGAILGLPKNQCLQHFTDEHAVFGLQVIEPIRTGHISINLLDTKGSSDFRPKRINPHTAMRYEIVRSPRYRVIFGHETLGEKLAELLKRRESHYTPCLGLAWMIAWLDGVRLLSGDRVSDNQEYQPFSSLVRTDDLRPGTDVHWNNGSIYQRIRMPAEMRADRKVTRYEEYIVETTGRSVDATLRSYWKLADGTCFSAM